MEWKAFLTQHRVPYTTTGPNASRGMVNIRCPWCGAEDPSEHLGISLRGRGYSCWRNERHRGSDQVHLIQALIHCSFEEAQRLLGGDRELPSEDVGVELRRRIGGEPERVERPTSLRLLPHFKSILSNSILAAPFHNYMIARGYHARQLPWLAETYALHYATRGRFAYRIIIPFHDRRGKLQTWTARSIVKHEEVRYLTLTHALSVCSPAETLLGLPLLWRADNPRVLLVCEGPFDAMWVTLYGRALGVYATCLFGLRMSEHQRALLEELRSRFPDIRLLLDSAATFQSFRMAHSGTNLGVVRLPEAVKDPAELAPPDLLALCTELL